MASQAVWFAETEVQFPEVAGAVLDLALDGNQDQERASGMVRSCRGHARSGDQNFGSYLDHRALTAMMLFAHAWAYWEQEDHQVASGLAASVCLLATREAYDSGFAENSQLQHRHLCCQRSCHCSGFGN
jgi:hypothetical protein